MLLIFFLVLRGHSIFPSPPQRSMTSDFEGFSIPDCIHDIYVPILIPEKEPVFSIDVMSNASIRWLAYFIYKLQKLNDIQMLM